MNKLLKIVTGSLAVGLVLLAFIRPQAMQPCFTAAALMGLLFGLLHVRRAF